VLIRQRQLVYHLLSEGSSTTYINSKLRQAVNYRPREPDGSSSEAVISQCSETVIEPIFVYCEIQSVV
jgi:hypothetical protein